MRLSRREIFSRDRYLCQYCGKQTRDLTLDHVLPRHRGGRHEWENLVSACKTCNHRKAGRTPHEANMRLAREPFAAAVGIPSDTLDDWSRGPVPAPSLRDRQRRQADRVSQGPPSPRDPGRIASGRPAEPRQHQQGYPPSGAIDR
jgi:hypothetical protein